MKAQGNSKKRAAIGMLALATSGPCNAVLRRTAHEKRASRQVVEFRHKSQVQVHIACFIDR
jgi:hypothetical protein